MTSVTETGTAAAARTDGAAPATCRYPGCASPARDKDPAAPGPRPGYCEQEVPEDRGDGTAVLVRHTAMTAFRRRQQLAGQPGGTGRSPRPSAGPRPSATTRSPR